MTKQITSKADLENAIHEVMEGAEVSPELQRTPRTRPVRRLSFVWQKPRRAMLFLMVLVLIAAGVYGGTFRLVNGFLPWASPEERAAVETARVVKAASRHILLPEELPVLAAVTDAAVLKTQQPFFENAENGDQLLMFPVSLHAIIYSPSRDVIVNVGPIEYGSEENIAPPPTSDERGTAEAAASHATQISVEVRNGTGIDGHATKAASTIQGDARYAVLRTADASTNTYLETLVVDQRPESDQQEAVVQLASALGGRIVTDMPQGESASNADVVVILGANP